MNCLPSSGPQNSGERRMLILAVVWGGTYCGQTVTAVAESYDWAFCVLPTVGDQGGLDWMMSATCR